MFNQGARKAPVHCSRKEVKRLTRAFWSHSEIARVLGVSRSQVQRVANGYRCRCLACPPDRILDELLALPRVRKSPNRKARQEKEGWLSKAVNTVGGVLALFNAVKEARNQAPTDKSSSDASRHPFLER